ncbi:OsmC family peroxiredoxin [Pseudactinotalea terrae]|uniref:OsmC family peroxiredoxin n=1 Tax=Pseudactinotalea terrae TaxID=1743262 RepID=UPI0012E1C57A|nr:OsmC family peroxiredoxin [Pseudactinotalea terrae]
MAAVSKATTTWNGDLTSGNGSTALETSGIGTYEVSWKARTEPGAGTTNPEELLAAAHASCFSMALSHGLAENGTPSTSVTTTAEVSFVAGTGITGISLTTTATVPDLDDADFQRIAEETKTGCPVSAALAAVPITLSASLA